jgi:hypothetical protein
MVKIKSNYMPSCKKEDIDIKNGWVNCKDIGTVALWWEYYDKRVCVAYGFGESFYAENKDEVIDGILKILNK